MELLETQNPERKRLLETSDRHKRELQKEVKDVSDKTERIITNTLIIGGSLALTYFVISQLTKSKSKRKAKKTNANSPELTEKEIEEIQSEPTLISQIGDKLISQASLVLLDLAKEKLAEYLAKRKDENP